MAHMYHFSNGVNGEAKLYKALLSSGGRRVTPEAEFLIDAAELGPCKVPHIITLLGPEELMKRAKCHSFADVLDFVSRRNYYCTPEMAVSYARLLGMHMYYASVIVVTRQLVGATGMEELFCLSSCRDGLWLTTVPYNPRAWHGQNIGYAICTRVKKPYRS